MTGLKIYEKLTMIKLKDGSILNTKIDPIKLVEMFNKQEFVLIDGKGFNRYEVKTFEEYKPTDVECFVLSQPKDIQDKLKIEIKIREEKNQITNLGTIKNILERLQKEQPLF